MKIGFSIDVDVEISAEEMRTLYDIYKDNKKQQRQERRDRRNERHQERHNSRRNKRDKVVADVPYKER